MKKTLALFGVAALGLLTRCGNENAVKKQAEFKQTQNSIFPVITPVEKSALKSAYGPKHDMGSAD